MEKIPLETYNFHDIPKNKIIIIPCDDKTNRKIIHQYIENNYPEIKKTFNELYNFNIRNNFIVKNNNNIIRVRGRCYDASVLFNSNVDFNNKIVCELGARDGIFCSWLTRYVKKIYVSDYFEEWGKGTEHDLGQIDYWTNIWKSAAPHPEKMIIGSQDITNLTYPDNFFDIVICTSVIEHMFNQKEWMGDMIAIREIARIPNQED